MYFENKINPTFKTFLSELPIWSQFWQNHSQLEVISLQVSLLSVPVDLWSLCRNLGLPMTPPLCGTHTHPD